MLAQPGTAHPGMIVNSCNFLYFLHMVGPLVHRFDTVSLEDDRIIVSFCMPVFDFVGVSVSSGISCVLALGVCVSIHVCVYVFVSTHQ